MSRYTLCINIRSDNKELLDNLMVTLESIQGDISDVEAVELSTTQDNTSASAKKNLHTSDPTTTQRNLFLDSWALNEAI